MTTGVNTSLTFGGNIPRIYDEILGPVYFEPYAIDMAARAASLHPDALLETAAGTGRVTVHLAAKMPETRITATDINPGMFALAKKKLEGKNIEWMLADAMALPFPDDSFDCVINQFGMMFFPDKIKGMSEALRVLKPGGTFMFTVWGKLEDNRMSGTGREIVQQYFSNNPPAFYYVPFSMHDVDEVSGMMNKAGFPDVRHEMLVKDCTAESAEVMAVGLLEGNSIINAIRDRDEGAVSVLKEQVKNTLVERFGDHPCKSTMQAIVFTAKKKR